MLCPDPHFVAYPACVALADGVFVPVPTSDANDFKVTAAALEERITPRTKAILIGYPSNPTGAVMERDDLLAVAELAEKHNLFVISDEIYDRLVYGVKHTCFASLPGMQRAHDTPRRLLQGLRHDRLAPRLRRRSAPTCSKG